MSNTNAPLEGHSKLLSMFNRITGGAKFKEIQCLKATIYGNCFSVETLIKFEPNSASEKIQKALKDCLQFDLYLFDFTLRLECNDNISAFSKVENILNDSLELRSGRYRYHIKGDQVAFSNFCLHRHSDLADSNYSLGPNATLDGVPTS